MKKRILTFLLLWAASLSVPTLGLAVSAFLDTTEKQAMAEALQYALENNRNDQESYWTNPDTGHSGSIVPVNRFVDAKGLTCREYIATLFIDGEEERDYGTACRSADGRWVVVLGQGATGHAEVVSGPRYVYVYRDPYDYYYPWVYYAPSHYPHHIFFSFVFSPHGGYFHRDYFHSGQRYYKGKPPIHRKEAGQDDRYPQGERRISHGTRSFRQVDDTLPAGPPPDTGDDRTEIYYYRDYRDGHRGKGHHHGEKGDRNEDHRKDGRDGGKDRPDRDGHDRTDGSSMGDMKPGEFGKLPDTRNIHRDQGVDVWAPIRSDWGYKGNSGSKKGPDRDRH